MKRRIYSIFLSSTGGDLKTEREAVFDAINFSPFCKCFRMEDFPASTDSAAIVCEREVVRSDILVGLIAGNYGSIMPKTEISYTEAEYNAAVAANVPCLMHLAPTSFKAETGVRETDVKHQKQQAFRARLADHHMSCPPRAWDDVTLLGMFVLEAIRVEIERMELGGAVSATPPPVSPSPMR